MSDTRIKDTCLVRDAYDVYFAPEGTETCPVPTLKPSQTLHSTILGLGLANIKSTKDPEQYNAAGLTTFRRWKQIAPCFQQTPEPFVWNLAEIISTALSSVGIRQDPLYLKKTPHPFSACSLVIFPKDKIVFAYSRATACTGGIKKGCNILAIPFNEELQPSFAYLKTTIKREPPSALCSYSVDQKRYMSECSVQQYSDAIMKEIAIEKVYGPKVFLAFRVPKTITTLGKISQLQLTHCIEESYEGDLSTIGFCPLTDFGLVCLFRSFISQVRSYHESSRIHGDIKTTNMVWRRTGQGVVECKFIDFEFMFDPSKSLHFTLKELGVYGSYVPTPPEVFKSLPPFKGDCFAAEMWALGCALFFPLFHKYPSWQQEVQRATATPEGLPTIHERQQFAGLLENAVLDEVAQIRRLIQDWSPTKKKLAEICFSMFDINPVTRISAVRAEERAVVLYRSFTEHQ